MSTKTTLKRIALVAVSALGFGLVTAVAPASAAITYSSSSSTGTLGTANGTYASTIITAVTTASNETTGTLYWVKSEADSSSALSGYNLTTWSSNNPGAVTVSTQSSGSGVDTGTVTWTTVGAGTTQIRLDYVKASDTGTFTLCAVALVSDACPTGNALWTVTVGTSAGTAGTNAIWALDMSTASSVNYASTGSVTATQVASTGGYIQLETQYEDITQTDPSYGFLQVTGSTFMSLETPAEWQCNASTVAASTECQALNNANITGNYARISLPATGSVTVRWITRTYSGGVATDTTRQTFTITASTDTTTYNYSTVTVAGQNNGYVVDSKVYAPSTASTLHVARVTVAQFNNANAALSGALARSVTATITGRGSLAAANLGAITASASAVLTSSSTFDIFGDGTAGTGTLTIAVGGSTVATIPLTFYGAVASIKVTPVYTIAREGGFDMGTLDTVSNGSDVSAGPLFATTVSTADGTADSTNDPAFAVEVLDALGNPNPTSLTITSSNPNVIVPLTSSDSFVDSGDGAGSAGVWVRHVKVKSGTTSKSGNSSTLTFSVTLSTGTVISATQVVTIGGVPATETLTLDKATYAPGEAMIVTRTAKDASGNPVYDGATAGAVAFNKAVGGTLGSASYVGGTAYTTQATRPVVFAPAASGSFEARMTGKVAGTTSAIVAKATVTDDAATAAASAAADAAAEAIDAANAATDAANLAAEAADAATVAAEEARDAADAATAAVEELSTQVSTLMAALKAQITTLANTVAKIAKRVRA